MIKIIIIELGIFIFKHLAIYYACPLGEGVGFGVFLVVTFSSRIGVKRIPVDLFVDDNASNEGLKAIIKRFKLLLYTNIKNL